MAFFLMGWVVAAAAYTLFAGQFSVDELAAAALCGFATSLWAASLRRAAGARFRFEPGAWGASWRPTADVPAATAKVALALLKAVATGGGGELRRQPFVHGRS